MLAALVRRPARLSPIRAPLALAVMVVVPSVPVLVFAASPGDMWRLDRAMPELPIWSLGLVLSLWAAASIRRRGIAWMVGLTGAFLTAQAATMSVVVSPMPEFYLLMSLYSLSFVLNAVSHVRTRDVAEGHRRSQG